jgi:WhiB family redox-sensing transcriptional regulator
VTDNVYRLFQRPDWMADANCRGLNPDLFFPNRGEPTDDLRQICRRCDVQTECLDYALDNNEDKGFWGGLSGRERRQIKAVGGRSTIRPITHGTVNGYNTHLRRDEQPCPACTYGHAQYRRLQAQAQRAKARGDVA